MHFEPDFFIIPPIYLSSRFWRRYLDINL